MYIIANIIELGRLSITKINEEYEIVMEKERWREMIHAYDKNILHEYKKLSRNKSKLLENVN